MQDEYQLHSPSQNYYLNQWSDKPTKIKNANNKHKTANHV